MDRNRSRVRQARERRLAIAPHVAVYNDLPSVFWPFLLSVSKPGFTSDVVTIDVRGHRVTRLGSEVTRSDGAPEGAMFLLGGSFSFGVGASDDAHTLAAALWRRTGTPCVNLGIRAAGSTEELISVLPFADRTTTFVACSGLNSLASMGLDRLSGGRATAIDPLFGPGYDEGRLRVLTACSLSRLASLANDPLGSLEDRELRDELWKRRRARISDRMRPARRLRKRVRGRFARPSDEPAAPLSVDDGDLDEIVAAAATRQLRDIRLLSRVVPDGARVVFALQPTIWGVSKELSAEEQELFDLLDVLQPLRWQRLKDLLETRWSSYASAVERGCREAGVPFVDLGRGDYSGWCFVDRIHMTDRGYEAAAGVLEGVLANGDR